MKKEGRLPCYENIVTNILDIVQNSIRAKADEISIEITESATSDLYLITITIMAPVYRKKFWKMSLIRLLQQGPKEEWVWDFLF